MSGWLRRNRLWLVALPFALLAMLAASAYHVRTFWYESGLHHVIARAEPGRSVAVVDPYEDAEGKTAYRFRVRLVDLTRVSTVPGRLGDPQDVPPGADAYRVRLSFSASPDVALNYCQLALVDADGNQYGGDFSDPFGQANKCVPEGHEGPATAMLKGDKRGRVPAGQERPPRWTVSPVVMVRHGVEPTAAWLWFERPDYVVLPVAR